MPSNQSDRCDIYQKTTDHIIAAIEKGAGDFQMPWHHSGSAITRPVNIASKKRYRGGNVLMLWATAQALSYSTGIWGTYRQWQALGAHVRKGQSGTNLIFWKRTEAAETGVNNPLGDADEGARSRMFARGFTVFNQDQVEGYEPPEANEPVLEDAMRIPDAQMFFDNLQIAMRYEGDQACYIPSADMIKMPEFARFKSSDAFYSTLFHEAGHATGAKTRLNRTFGKHFGDELYSREELTAELTAAYIMADLGLACVPRPDHAAYIQSWLTTLRDDPKALLTAASKAQAAADWMHEAQERALKIAA
jgi:antirestriction protein ArdC